MPTIIGQVEQRKALHDISTAVKKMSVINEFLQGTNPSGEYTVSYKSEDGKRHSTIMFCDDKSTIDSFVSANKRKFVEEMIALASQNNISLDSSDKIAFDL